MKDLLVYVCKHNHIKYSMNEPKICNICGNKDFKLIHGVIVSSEDIYGIPRESQNNNS